MDQNALYHRILSIAEGMLTIAVLTLTTFALVYWFK
ncbi:Uncharacterised protein [Providencia heimbachae]|nr:Uncharacterised protein [Providencia heimbachae]